MKIKNYPTLSGLLTAEISDLDWASLLAHHRFLYLAYQNLHWTAHGSSYYGDHLLFQRLYEKLANEVDQIAERAIGMGHPEIVGLQHTAPLLLNPMDLYVVVEVEKTLAGALFDYEANASSLGVKDLMASLADSREEDLYLLGQRIK